MSFNSKSFTKLSLVCHKIKSMEHPIRIELTNNGLLA